MSDTIIVDGDMVIFEPLFGNRTVIVMPTTIRGSGHATVDGRRVCIAGDEKKVSLNVQYMTPVQPTPGSGRLTILALLPTQQTPLCQSGAPLIVKGQQFIAQFMPLAPALGPPPGNTPDVPAPSLGKGRFVGSQFLARAG